MIDQVISGKDFMIWAEFARNPDLFPPPLDFTNVHLSQELLAQVEQSMIDLQEKYNETQKIILIGLGVLISDDGRKMTMELRYEDFNRGAETGLENNGTTLGTDPLEWPEVPKQPYPETLSLEEVAAHMDIVIAKAAVLSERLGLTMWIDRGKTSYYKQPGSMIFTAARV